ncbi:efflux RND transporter permease subunit [Pseudomonas sp. PDM22]|uniref:efflux RND transporter permease subunit n=1 Tax=Pseudomonas sp. PDM22 TaxID=2769287 RepID=UPI0009DA464C|nr:efflux RND transporter permease subunit [Pseudomonas sp. PDM22]MBD9516630.1 efflux RND transporter permease subunit [Pseudomonas sp. PDM22]OQR35956.1 MFS transporter [Pseudomonas sp. T]
MDISGYFIRNKVSSWIVILLLALGGLYAIFEIGRLEDPAFTVKTAVVATRYAGASPQQVEEEVTYPLENAIQQLAYVDKLTSISSAGLSQITVNVKPQYRAGELPQIWDELRRKVNDLAPHLPPGVSPPQVNDDFGDVYGILLSLSGDGYSYQELRDYADYLRRELVLVPGLSKVVVSGLQAEQVQVEVSREKMNAMGVPLQRLVDLLNRQNVVSDAGSLWVGSESIRLHPTGEFADVGELERLLVSAPGSAQLIRLGDIATVKRGFTDSPSHLWRADGKPALALGIAFAPQVNVVKVGDAVHQRLDQLESERPAGMQLTPFYDQAVEVHGAVNGFLLSFVTALAIVVGTLLVFMGLRSGLVIAGVLALNVLGSLLLMYLLGIELQRISLGALIISLCMLVDNAIVVVEGVLVGRLRGQGIDAAIRHIVRLTALPLLGATVIAVLAFAPIGLSADSTGEYCRSLFDVLLVSLLLSWVTAMTLAPLFARWAFAKMPVKADSAEPHAGWLYRAYRSLLEACLRQRALTLGVLAVALAASLLGFSQVRQNFFPPANTPMFFVDLWLPQGTAIEHTRDLAAEIDRHITALPGVERTVTSIGQGAPRFILTYGAERQHANYAQVLVRTENRAQIPGLIAGLQHYLDENYPQVQTGLKRLMFGPSNGSAIEVRLTGPDPQELRRLGAQVGDILAADPVATGVSHDWQARALLVRPQFNEARGRELGIDKRDLDSLLRMSFSGLTVGLYRDGTQQMPIVVRERDVDAGQINDLMLWSPVSQRYLPIEQVVGGFDSVWEDPLILREDRKRTLTVMADVAPQSGETSSQLLNRVRPQIEALPLPPGYELAWGGDVESSSDARNGVLGSLPMAFLAMFIITVLMFSSPRKALLIWLTVPLAMIGVTLGFLLTGIPFGFMALLGLLSLSGMLVRNGIVLLEEVDNLAESGQPPREALVNAACARLRPICLTALTTILGLAPLLLDAFFQSMSVVIMFGLGFATLLTLIVLPVLYASAYRLGGSKVATH